MQGHNHYRGWKRIWNHSCYEIHQAIEAAKERASSRGTLGVALLTPYVVILLLVTVHLNLLIFGELIILLQMMMPFVL